MKQTEAKIFLAGDRGKVETDLFRSYHTFQFGGYQPEHKAPFGGLYVLNDDTIAPGQSIELTVEEDTEILLLPTVGGVVCKATGDDMEWEVEAGQCATLCLQKGSAFRYTNPLDELVNVLQFWVKAAVAENSTSIVDFDLNSEKNKLLPIASSMAGVLGFAGKFNGRSEATYAPHHPDASLFITVVEGAFEVQNRLLETRDSLGLMNVDELEFEALSNEAILLVLEWPANE